MSRSTPVPMPRTAKDAAADLHRLLRRVSPDRPVVLGGHSTGGLIVRLYASLHPSRVAGLIEVDSLSEYLRRRFTRAQMVAYDELNNGPIPGLEHYPHLEEIGFRRSFRQMARVKRRAPLGGLPVTVISRALPLALPDGLPVGLTTRVAERAWNYSQRRLARLTSATRHRVAEHSSHYVMFSQPRLITREVRRMVKELP